MTPLKRLRLRLKRTLHQVSEKIGTDPGNLSRIENGKQKSLDLAEKLVGYFGRSAITEAEILYPERYPSPKKARNGGARASTGESA